MLSEADRQRAADILMEAAKTRKQAVQLSVTFPGIGFEDAYAISTICAKRRMAAGEKLIGHKVGLTSKAMQQSSQIDEPDYGYLFDSMMVADGAKVPHENYCAPRVEEPVEIGDGRLRRRVHLLHDAEQRRQRVALAQRPLEHAGQQVARRVCQPRSRQQGGRDDRASRAHTPPFSRVTSVRPPPWWKPSSSMTQLGVIV